MENVCCSLALIAAKSVLTGSIAFDCALPCEADNDCIRIKCCWVEWIDKQTLFVELIELFVFAFLPCVPV